MAETKSGFQATTGFDKAVAKSAFAAANSAAHLAALQRAASTDEYNVQLVISAVLLSITLFIVGFKSHVTKRCSCISPKLYSHHSCPWTSFVSVSSVCDFVPLAKLEAR